MARRKQKSERKRGHSGRVKFYADENVHEGLIEYLRTAHAVNITSARELGYTARDDEFQFREAKRQKRFLLTCDKDFLNHSAFPFLQMVGVVILDVPQEHPGIGWMSLWLETEIVPSGRGIAGTKIVVHRDSFDIYFVDDTGKIQKQKLYPMDPVRDSE